MRWIPFIALLTFFLSHPAELFGQRSIQVVSDRLALVIGNSKYKVGPLRNPANDAQAMSETLTELGFSVTLIKDGSLRDMEQAVREFGKKLRRGEAGLFYYAGHGLQVGGENYLVPIGATIEKQEDVRYEAMSVGRVLAEMEAAENRLNILILDACRNNPFARAWRSSEGGLAQMSAPSGTLIAYATAPGSVASDGAGDNGLYTEMLLKHLQEPGLQVEEMFKKVRISVMDETDGEQTPWESSSLVGNLVFNKLQANLTVQNIITPDAPTSTDFSLDDITQKASDEKAVRQAWQNKLVDMTDAFQQVRKIDLDDIDIGLKINAWQRFQAAFKEDNPYSVDDNEMLSQSRTRITALQREQKQVAQQLASLSSDSGSAISSSGKACDVCPEMVLIPAGSFRMGDLNGGGRSNEKPVHNVTVSAFAMAKTEVTFAEFDAFARATSRALPKDEGWGRGNRPVINVSWHDAKAYAKWLSNKTGRRFRLPSESEWEYAARAGTETKYSWGNAINCSQARYGHYKGDCGNESKSVSVGSYSANAFGLYDMHGNVWEWVEDCYHDSYNGAPANGSSWTAGSCDSRVLRGGSWYYKPGYLRSANRSRYEPDFRYYFYGIRIVQDL